MKKNTLYRVNKFLAPGIIGEKCPDIRWDDVVRIEAFGTDVISAFAIVVTFHYADGKKSAVHPEQRGYYEIVESLDQRFPSISDDWFAEMQTAGKDFNDVWRNLFSRPTAS